MAESRAKRVRIKEMDGWTLGLLVDYIYTAEIQVTEDNVQVNPRPVVPWCRLSLEPLLFQPKYFNFLF